ncbi:unnamed protein product, partial [Musa banksii]
MKEVDRKGVLPENTESSAKPRLATSSVFSGHPFVSPGSTNYPSSPCCIVALSSVIRSRVMKGCFSLKPFSGTGLFWVRNVG